MLSVLFYVFACFALLSGVMVIRAKNPVYSVLFLILVFCNVSGLLLLLNLDFFAMVFLVVYVGAIAVLFLFVVMMLNVKLAEINDNILRYLPIGGVFGLLFLGEIILLLEQDLVPVIFYQTQLALPLAEQWFMFGIFILLSFYNFFWLVMSQPWNIFSAMSQWNIQWLQLKERCQSYETLMRSDASSLNALEYVVWPQTMDQTTTISTIGHVVYTYYLIFFLCASIILLIAMIGSIVLTMHKGVFVKRQDVFEQNTRDFSKTLQKIKTI
jgi:NADH:ubiquinone oxidoreductase subunit 6 (subunit J)|tara:strand:+ start:2358 stop:3164 length:807 start_codon:yes stop_codon:yes gene_type:complete